MSFAYLRAVAKRVGSRVSPFVAAERGKSPDVLFDSREKSLETNRYTTR